MGTETLRKALVAGGAGFIGSHLVHRLLLEGYEVLVIDNLITGFEKNLFEFKSNPNFTFVNFDISNAVNIESNQIHEIFHLASPASPPKYLVKPQETIFANVHGTINLIDVAKKHNARMLFASTSEIYGDPLISPQREDYWGNVNPIGPRSVYDESKRLGETLCAQAAREGVNVGIVRIFNTYGPKMDPYDGRVVSTFIRQALQGKNFTVNGDGKQTRSFCHVDDMVDGIIKYARSGAVRPVNLGNPVELQVLDLALKIAELFSAQPIIDFLEKVIDDPMQRKPDITLAQQLLDWSPNISLDKGLTSTFNWMKSNLEN